MKTFWLHDKHISLISVSYVFLTFSPFSCVSGTSVWKRLRYWILAASLSYRLGGQQLENGGQKNRYMFDVSRNCILSIQLPQWLGSTYSRLDTPVNEAYSDASSRVRDPTLPTVWSWNHLDTDSKEPLFRVILILYTCLRAIPYILMLYTCLRECWCARHLLRSRSIFQKYTLNIFLSKCGNCLLFLPLR